MCDSCGCDGHSHTHDDKVVDIQQSVLSQNDKLAQINRNHLMQHHILGLNLVSSPGSGKTSLLVKTAEALKSRFPVAVIEGDQQTDNDARRIQAVGVAVEQINTGKSCHLDAHGISHAIEKLALKDHSCLFIENVGNLVCPAMFDLGEKHKVAILSVTEGDDKPIKYPYMFNVASVIIINKIDLLPYVDFDVNKCIEYARRVNPLIHIFQVSVKTGEGLEHWYQWILNELS